MKDSGRFEQIDRAALINALLALKLCPKCRRSLHQVTEPNGAYGRIAVPDTYGCVSCDDGDGPSYVIKPT